MGVSGWGGLFCHCRIPVATSHPPRLRDAPTAQKDPNVREGGPRAGVRPGSLSNAACAGHVSAVPRQVGDRAGPAGE